MARVKDTGYVNPQEVYNYLVNVKGLSREHALGMLSNIQAESGFKIAVQEYGKPQGTGGVGLFQHTGPRRQALVKYTGGDVNDWTKQVDFALQEGVTKTYLSQKFETPEEASIWFTTKWERPANANQRAQERLKYLNNYSNFSGYESTYQPSSSPSSQGAGQNAQQGAAQMPIPFEVVIAGKPQQVAFSYEDFQKALATTQKEEEKEQESEARQELKQEMTTQEAFLKAMESISLPSASSQGNQQQQFASQGTTGYEPLPIQEVSMALPQLPNIFSTQLPEMVDGGKVYSVKGEKFYKGPDGNWYRGESMNPQQRIYDKGTLNYINANAASSIPTNQGPQGAVKPAPLRPTSTVSQTNQKIYAGNPTNFSETTQGVAAKTVPQSAGEQANVEGARQDIAQRKANLEKVLITQGKTPEQAASIVGSYGSDWTTLEAANARALDTMARRAEAIQSGNTPDKMSTFTPRAEQPWNDKLQDIVFNPFTAAGYALRGQEIPDYLQEKADNGTLGYWANGQFVEGRNALDTAVDIGTPIGYAHSASNIIDRATNDKEDFWTEENAWDALNILPGIKLLKGVNAAKDLSSAVTNTGLTQLRNNALDLAQRTRLTASKPQIVDSAIDAGNVLREPYYAPQRPSLLNPAIAPQNIKTLPTLTSQRYPGIMPKYDIAPMEATAQPNVLAQLGIRENSEWFPGIKEFQKQVAAKDVSDLPLREAESWLYNWINHPTTQKKMYNSYQEALNSPMKVDNLSKMNVVDRIRVKEAYQHNLEEAYKQVASYNPFNRLSYKPIRQQVLDLPHNEHTDNTGVSYTHGVMPDNLLMPEIMNKTRKEFDTGKNYISRTISDEDKILTGTHEGSHDWAKDFALEYLGQKDMFNKQSEPLFSPFITKWNNKLEESKLTKDKAGIDNAKKTLAYLEYLKEPTELHARIMESRKYFNLTPDDVVTPEKAREMMLSVGAKKTPINFNFGNALLEDPKAAAYMFNEAWMAIPAIGGAALLNNSNNQSETTPENEDFRKGGQTSPQDTKEMLDGIADILRQVVNVNNRKAIAKNMIGDFNREGLDYDLNNFLRNSQVKMQEGGPVKPPTFNLSYNPYVYNPNELTGYRGYGDLSGTSLGVSTPDLLGREKKINALKVPFSASVNRLYDPNVQNTTIDYSDQQNLNQDMTAEQLQTGAQQQLDSASQPYLDKNPLGFNIQTGVSGSGLNSNVKRRTKIDASVGVGYNPLSGFNAGASGKFSFALGNDFYRPLKNTGDWRAVGNVQPFGMSVNQLSAYNEQQDMIQSNLQQVASTGAYSDLTQNVNNYDNTKPGVASGVQFTLGAGVDGSVKLPIGMLNAGAGLKYNRAAGEAERLSPTAYVGYSVSGAELSRLGSKLPNINLPDNRRSNYETLANQDLEAEKGEWVQGPDGQFTWRDFPGFNGAFNASTFEGEDIYVPTVLPNKQNGGVVKTFALF